ncbi:hypothetical protein [Dysosmobacter welbionis]|uniref:hypothetical protein n=1 Tax=Dysosmobacter welbionis TaxID=2093857 RepID=UPI003AF8C2A7
MSRKKVNPNRVPVGPGDYNLEQIKNQAANGKVLQTWAVLLAALSNLGGMTTGKLLDIWQQIDQAPTQIHTFEETEQELVKIRELTGVSLSLQRSSSAIHTKGDLTHFIRTTTANAVSAAFAIIAEPMIREKIIPPEELRIVLQRAAAMNEEIADGEISVQDIQQMLLDEYGLKLVDADGQCSLVAAENTEPAMLNL